LKNGFGERKEAVKALELKTNEVSPIYLQKWLRLRISTSFDFVLRKRKERGEVLTSFYCKIV